MLSWAMIAIQLVLVALALHLWRWHVLPNLRPLGHRALIVDVWGPMSVVIPLVFTVGWVGYSVRESGWVMLGGPIVCGLFAVAVAAVMRPHGERSATFSNADGLSWSAGAWASIVGIILLLLGAAHVMNIWMGQIAFALLAVVLWTNTPPARESNVDNDQAAAWLGMIGIVLAGFVLGGTSLAVAEGHRVASAVILVGYGGAVFLLAARYAGPAVAVRMGLWAAGLGVLAALGAISILHMLPQAIQLALGGHVADVRSVAHSFGAFALEAVMLLVLPLLVLGLWRLDAPARRMAGLFLMAAIVAVVTWRLAGM